MAGYSNSDDHDDVTISFGAKFAQSEQFQGIFREGMALVEEAAAYLDGNGRLEARALKPPLSLAYATESMRLTTRLMQLASWLLIRRAVTEGELSPEQALEEQRKIKLPVSDHRSKEFEALPEKLRRLISDSLTLQERVVRLDRMLNRQSMPAEELPEHPLHSQMSRLRAAFDTGK